MMTDDDIFRMTSQGIAHELNVASLLKTEATQIIGEAYFKLARFSPPNNISLHKLQTSPLCCLRSLVVGRLQKMNVGRFWEKSIFCHFLFDIKGFV